LLNKCKIPNKFANINLKFCVAKKTLPFLLPLNQYNKNPKQCIHFIAIIKNKSAD